MSQFDFGTIDPNSKSGPQLALDLNQFRDALNSGHRGERRPPYAKSGMSWVREVSSERWDLMIYDGTTDQLLRSINPSTGKPLQIPQESVQGLIELGQALAENSATMKGATASAAGVKGLVPAPAIADKDRFLKGDGSYGDVGGLPVGSLVPWHVSEASLPSGYIPANGQLIDRAMFPQLWALVASVASTDAQWLGDVQRQAGWSDGNGTTTFRMPDLNGKGANSQIEALFLRGYGRNSGDLQRYQRDQLQNITGALPVIPVNSGAASGAFATTDSGQAYMGGSAAGRYLVSTFDAGRVVRAGNETRPSNVAVIWCFIGGTVATNQGTVDITATAAQVTAQASQIQNLQSAMVKRWSSGPLSWSNAAIINLNHNLGLIPSHVVVKGRYKVAFNNMNVGEEEFTSGILYISAFLGVYVRRPTTTTLQLQIGRDGLRLSNNAGEGVVVTPAQVDLVVEIWA